MIETTRLRLVPLDSATARAILAGDRDGRTWEADFPRADDRDAAAMFLRTLDPVFGCRIVVEKEPDRAIGTVGFYGPPDASGTLLVGYGLVPAARGLGYATEALRALVAYAFEQPAVHAVAADPLRDNQASHGVLEKAGFRRTHSTDEAHWYRLEHKGAHAVGRSTRDGQPAGQG